MPKPRLLLHVCCAPCSTHVIDELVGEFDLVCFFYGPNIHPKEEYERRLEESERYCGERAIELIKGEYDVEDWLEAVQGHEEDQEGGGRCSICYELRLERTAREALERGIEWFASTLTVSPHKKAEVISQIGKRIENTSGVKFLAEDFKKQHGFQKSVVKSREHGLYRQSYCGCVFSQR